MLTVDVVSLRESFGGGSDDEVLAGCHYWNPSITTLAQAHEWLWTIVWWLLNTDQYLAAMAILWSQELFDSRPLAAQRLVDAYLREDMVIVLGGAAQGKSYVLQAVLLTDWLRDPEFTGVKVLSITGSHALANTFSSLQRFYESALLPMPGLSRQRLITLDPRDLHASLQVLPTQPGSERNLIKGFHTIRREVAHPEFGLESRIRVFVDEGEHHPPGTFAGVSNVKANVDGRGRTKLLWACNPGDPLSKLACEAEPEAGFGAIDIDRDFQWYSRAGYFVLRLDPAFSENVLTGKDIYPGMMSAKGYEIIRARYGGRDKDYMTFGRGFYPLGETLDELIPRSWLNEFYGQLRFMPSTEVRCAGIDLAFALHGDKAIFCACTYGRAWGWTPEGGSQVIRFDEPRWAVQVDQFRTLEKMLPNAMARQITQIGNQFGVEWDWCAVDASGIGHGVAGILVENGKNVLRIAWGEGAPHIKLLATDTQPADELYDGIAAAMYFHLAYLICSGYIKCSPHIVCRNELEKEICGRKQKRSSRLNSAGKPLSKLEEKRDYKSRMGASPDHADSLVMAAFRAMTLGPEKAQLVKRRNPVWVPKAPDYDEFNHIKTINGSDWD